MQVAKLTAVQAAIINNARGHSANDERKLIKKDVFGNAKHRCGIPASNKVVAETDPAQAKTYLMLKDKRSGRYFQLGDDGKFNGTMVTLDQIYPPAPAPAPALSSQGTVFGGGQSSGWFRLDPSAVASALNGLSVQGSAVALPDPNLALAGSGGGLAITADGSIYRKAS